MKNNVYGLIFAGGTGTRMNYANKPKQFLEVDGKPIIIHTLEWFEKSDIVDEVVVVCIESWIDYLKELLIKFNISKVKWIVGGGNTGQLSIYNGLCELEKNIPDIKNSIVLIHDGVRPLINTKVIKENVETAREKRTCITVAKAIETIITVDENELVTNTVDRAACRMAKAPQTFYLKDILDTHRKALSEGKDNIIDSATMMSMYGYKIFTVEGPAENIKITTPIDYFTFKTIYATKTGEETISVRED